MIFNMIALQEATTHAGEIMKEWTSYGDFAIKIYKRRTSFQIRIHFGSLS